MAQKGDPRGLTWTEISDFSPGIHNASAYSLASPGVALPAPQGAAQETNTYRCFALANGGLAPLPKRTDSFSITAPEASAPSSGYWALGGYAFGPQGSASGATTGYTDSLFFPVGYTPNASTNQRFRLYHLKLFKSPFAFSTLKSINTAYAGADFYEPVTIVSSRANTADPTLAGNPLVAYCYYTPAGANEKTIDVFPDPAAPTVEAVKNISTTRFGDLVGHQGRLVLLEHVSYSFGDEGGIPTNEQVSFTNPSNSLTLGTQNQIFVQEYPNGYSAWGSVSAGELFLVKMQNGGVSITGDIASPTVTRLPGVISGAGVLNHAAATSVGLMYGTRHEGPCLWRGSDTSQKVGQALDPMSFIPNRYTATAPGNVSVTQYYEPWGQWVYCTNNWVYDTVGGGWWLAEDRSLVNMLLFTRGFLGLNMYGVPASFSQASPIAAWAFNREAPALSYSWLSHPLPETIDRLIDVRYVVLRAQGSGTVTLTLTGQSGSPSSSTSSSAIAIAISNTAAPQVIRQPVGLSTGGALVASDITIRIQSSGASAAPVVYSVGIGYRQRMEVPAA